MNVKHLDHLNLTVNDLDETEDWYGRVFGFKRVEDGLSSSGTPFRVLRAGEAMLCIYKAPDRAFLGGDELMAKKLHGVNHFALRITDRDAWLATAEREGVEFGYGGGEIRWPNSSAWYVLDPTGYEIEVVLWNNDTVAFPPMEAARA